MSIYQERLDRYHEAIALEPADRASVSFLGPAVNAQFTGTKLSDYCNDMELSCNTNLKGIEMVGDVDTTQTTIFQPRMLASFWLTEVLMPGEALPENELWQMKERETITQADYDEILEGGFGPWYQKVLVERLDDPMAKAASYFAYMPTALQRFAEAGLPSINNGMFYTPFEMFCGGRSMISFLMDDLVDIPEKVEAVFAKVQEFNMAQSEAMLKELGPGMISGWLGSWRGTPGILSPAMFERFSWKYIKEMADLVISYGVTPILHFDSSWTPGLHYLRELPAKKCILSLDGMTDIRKAKEVVGDRMCIMGDVPSQMLAMSSAEKVTEYCKSLIKDMGTAGFILCSGCDVPYNAKLENVQAMVASVHS